MKKEQKNIENPDKNKSKKKKIKLIILFSCLGLFLITLLVYYFGASYPQFDKMATKEFEIPGLDSSFVPQGLEYDNVNDKFVVCGYMSNGSPSRIYIVDAKTGKTEKYVTLITPAEDDAKDYKGHAGGIALSYPFAYLSGDGVLYRFIYDTILYSKNGDKIPLIDSYITGNGADYVDIIDGNLVVGEFYRKKSNPTKESHKLTLNGQTHRALSFVYKIDQDKNAGIDPQMLYAISTPDQVQGMCLNKEGNLVLSTSFGLPNSTLYVYKNITENPTTQVEIDNKKITVYFLSKQNLIKTYTEIPCMSEEMILVNDKIYLLFESKCRKYKFFTRTRINNVYSLAI